MAKSMLLEDTRALRREQREARIARKQARRRARELKDWGRTTVLETMALEPIAIAAPGPAISAPEAEASAGVKATAFAAPAATPEPPTATPTPSPQPAARVPSAKDAQPVAATGPIAEREPGRGSRRERDVAEFLARRDEALSVARNEARERIAHFGEEEAVRDALIALAHPEASPWRRHRERLSEAIAGGRIPEIGAAARRACRGVAGDAARTSRRAPDPQLALAVTVAYAVIARAPWAAVRGRRAERSGPARQPRPRAFWR
jgi:hypothetical protein